MWTVNGPHYTMEFCIILSANEKYENTYFVELVILLNRREIALKNCCKILILLKKTYSSSKIILIRCIKVIK